MIKSRERSLAAAEYLSRVAEDIRRGRRELVSITVQRGERPAEKSSQPWMVEREPDGSEIICIETQER